MTDEPHDQLPAELLAALRTPPPVDAAVADAHVDRALALFDSMDIADADPERNATVTPLRSRRQPVRWLGAAAAVIVVAGGVWLAARGGQSAPVQSADRAAGSALATTTTPLPSAAKSVVPTSNPEFAPSYASRTPAALANGSADSTEDQLATPSTEPTTTCRAPRLRAALISIGTTTVGGQPRLLYTYVSGPDGQIITRVLLDPTTCARS